MVLAANAKSSMLHENTPDAACMDEINRKDGTAVSVRIGNITPAKLLCEWLQWLQWLHILWAAQISIASFVLRTQRPLQQYKCSTTCWLFEPTLVCLPAALSRSDRCVLALLLVRVECAVLCCAVPGAAALTRSKESKGSQEKVPQQIISSSLF